MQAIKTGLAENFGGIAQKAVRKQNQFALEQVPSLAGKVAVVTGGSEGVGYACTHTLLSKGISKLFVLSLHKEVADGALDAVRSEMGDEAAKKTEWIHCDLSDWKKTGEAAFRIADSTDRLDILINNAARGIMTAQKAPSNGVDMHMAGNHIGHVVLTSHLLPLMKKTAEKGETVRIVNLGSNAHQQAPSDLKFESAEELNKDYGPMVQYGRSKLATILYSRYLAKHLSSSNPKILVNATHPGIVDTAQTNKHIHEAYPLGGYATSVGMAPFKKSAFEGAISTMFAATVTDMSGQYICPPAIIEPGSQQSQDEALGEQLMKLTRDLVQEKTEADPGNKSCPFRDY